MILQVHSSIHCKYPPWYRHYLPGVFYLLFLLVILSPAGLAHAEDKADQIDLQYNLCKESFNELERNEAFGKVRDNWHTGIGNFRRIYLSDPTGHKAPACLYMMARMSQRMFDRFHDPADLDDAYRYYDDIASLFPHDSLADDALFRNAEITLFDRKDPAEAARIFQKLIAAYPAGDRFSQSIDRLHQLEKDHGIPLPENIDVVGHAHSLVEILPPKHWASDEYTRIVIPASGPVYYSNSLLEKHGDQPRRLYIDFANSRIDPQAQAPLPIEDGLLRQVRSGQFNPTTVRVVLDIESISNYKIFSLKDPFRVVIDVHGEKKKVVKKEPIQEAPEPPLPAPVAEPSVKKEPTAVRKSVSAASPPETKEPFITLQDEKKKKPLSKQDKKKSEKAVTVSPSSSSDAKITLAQQLGLGVRRIVIDPGHGGKDPGAMAFNLKEKDVVLSVAQKVANILKNEHQYEVILTRNKDIFLPLEERTAIANTEKADLFVSIHTNAHPQEEVRGVETFYLNLATNEEAMRVAALENATSTHNISDLQDILSDLMQNSKIQESSLLAESVQSNMVSGLKKKQYKTKDLGVKQAPFYVLLGAQMPAILAEISFLTNPEEAKLLVEEAYLELLAKQIADGIVQYATHYAKAKP